MAIVGTYSGRRHRSFDASVEGTNGASLKVFRTILRQFGDGPGLHQARRSFRPTFPRPRLPASWAVADPVVRNRLQQRVDQPSAILWPRRLDLRGERCDGLLGPLEADLPRFGVALGRGDGHDGAEQVVRQ